MRLMNLILLWWDRLSPSHPSQMFFSPSLLYHFYGLLQGVAVWLTFLLWLPFNLRMIGICKIDFQRWHLSFLWTQRTCDSWRSWFSVWKAFAGYLHHSGLDAWLFRPAAWDQLAVMILLCSSCLMKSMNMY